MFAKFSQVYKRDRKENDTCTNGNFAQVKEFKFQSNVRQLQLGQWVTIFIHRGVNYNI